jgi:DNA-binding PadR family transcriptional regulator
MSKDKQDWGLGDIFDAAFGPAGFGFWAKGSHRRHGWRRQQVFEAGEMKLVILRLLKEQPRHGYDIIKALEEKLAGCYTPSAGTVYPTLQMLEDQGLVRGVETEGKRVYHITPEGEQLLEERRSELDEIIARVGETIRGFAGGAMGELHTAFGQVASRVFREAYRRGPHDPGVRQVTEILRRTADDVERAWRQPSAPSGGGTHV